jgi:anti-sigma factor RsiW
MESSDQENLIVRYLLGELSEADADALEVRLLSEPDLAEEMQSVEYELIDRYVRNQMHEPERKRFESHYLSTPLHRERLATARGLLQAADEFTLALPARETYATVASERTSWWRSMFATPAMAWSSGVAIALLGAMIVWLLFERGRLQQQLQAQHLRAQSLESELAQQRSALATLEQLLAQRPAISPTPLPSPDATPNLPAFNQVFALMLVPQLRGAGETTTITLTDSIKTVRLKAKIEPDEATRYQAELRTADGASVLQRRLNVTRRATQIELDVPATRLGNNDYVLTLSTVNATGELEEVNRFTFRVVR